MTHLQAEQMTVERLRRQLAERRSYRDLLLEVAGSSGSPDAEDASGAYLPGNSLSIDWTSLGHHDWTG